MAHDAVPRAVIAVVAIVALSGCLTVGMAVDSQVASDGTIERYELQMNVSGQAYSMMQMAGGMQGGGGSSQFGSEQVEEDVRSNLTDEFSSVGDVQTNVTEGDESMRITIVLTDAVPAEGGNISVTTEGDTLVYRDEVFNRSFGQTAGTSMSDDGGSSGMMDGMEEPQLHLRYSLEMPGEIQDSNADSVEGSEATWNRSYVGDEMQDAGFTVEAESSTGGGGMPGFGATVALVALLAVALLATRRRR